MAKLGRPKGVKNGEGKTKKTAKMFAIGTSEEKAEKINYFLKGIKEAVTPKGGILPCNPPTNATIMIKALEQLHNKVVKGKKK